MKSTDNRVRRRHDPVIPIIACRAGSFTSTDTQSRHRRSRFRSSRSIRVSLRRTPRLRGHLPSHTTATPECHCSLRLTRSSMRRSIESRLPSSSPWTNTSNMKLPELDVPSEEPVEPQSKRRKAWKRLTDVRLSMNIKRTKKASPCIPSRSTRGLRKRSGYPTQAAAEWVPDTASSRCQICLAAFRPRHGVATIVDCVAI